MRYRYFLIVGILLLLKGCKNPNTETSDILVLEHSYRNNKICKSDSLFLNRQSINDTTTLICEQKDNTLGYFIKKADKNDSVINILNKNCPLVDRKTIEINNKKFEILKYFYDEQDMIDEETSYFYNQNYGVLVVFNDGWMTLISTFEYDEISKILIDSILKDRTGFYLENNPLPSLFNEEKVIDIKE